MTNPERISDERLREILAGCEGVTPGPWLDGTHHRKKAGDREFAPIFADGAVPVAMVPLSVGGYQDPEGVKNAAHIARLDPQTVAAICRELLSLRESHHSGEGEAASTKEIDDPSVALARLAAGDSIAYSIDGETAWLTGAGREWVTERVVLDLRERGYLLRISDADEPFNDRDVISEAGKLAAAAPPSNPGTSKVEPKTLTGKAATDAIFDPKYDNVVD